MTDSAWHERRRKGIGGSDANTLVHYPARWRELWEIKTGRRADADLSMVVRVAIGKQTEALNIKLFEHASQMVSHSHGIEIAHPRELFMRGSFDGLVGEDSILECKHTSEGKNIEDVAEYYRPQLSHYCFVAGRCLAYLSVLFGNARHEYVSWNPDAAYTSNLLQIEREFWHYVTTDKAPPKWMK